MTTSPSDPFNNADMTLREARVKLRELAMADGHKCPVCTQFTKVYKRRITTSMARDLILIYRIAGDGKWFHMPTLVQHEGGDVTKLRYWGLIEEEQGHHREDGSPRTGYWRITTQGIDFAQGNIAVAKYAHVFDGRCLKLSSGPVGIRACLGARFDYNELMGLAAGATGSPGILGGHTARGAGVT